MFPIIAVVVGLMLGFMASSNPIVAIICGGMLGLIAWALTGFKVGDVQPNPAAESPRSASTRTNSERPSANDRHVSSRFAVDGHGEVTPRQLGASFVQQSFPMSEILADMLFGAGKPGRLLPLKMPVSADPLAARLFLTAMLIASYFVHPVKLLGVDDETKTQIMEGVVEGLVKLRKPDGLLVSREDIDLVRSLVSSFYDCLVKDLDQGGNRDAEHRAPHSKPPKATELLLSLVVSHYSGGGPASQAAVAKLTQQGFYHPSYAAATEVIDEAAHSPHQALANFNVKLAGS